MMQKLDRIRTSINQVDEQIIELLVKRRSLSLEAAQEKIGQNYPLFDPEREQMLLNQLFEKSKQAQVPRALIELLYKAIFKDSLAHQRQYLKTTGHAKDEQSEISVAYTGCVGSDISLVVRQFFQDTHKTRLNLSCHDEASVFDALQLGQADYGVVQAEDLCSNALKNIYHRLVQSRIHIVGEIKFCLENCLLASKSAHLENIRHIYAHPDAHMQCMQCLERLGPVEVCYCESSAQAIEKALACETNDVAAIGCPQEGQYYQLKPLLQTCSESSFRRFLVLSCQPRTLDETDITLKTTLVCGVSSQSNVLADILMLFKVAEIPVINIVSKPVHSSSLQMMLYLDVQANQYSPEMQRLLQDLALITQTLKVLGCYPSAVSYV